MAATSVVSRTKVEVVRVQRAEAKQLSSNRPNQHKGGQGQGGC
jgi:hypothetical protein